MSFLFFPGLCRSAVCHPSPLPPLVAARSGAPIQRTCTPTWLALCLQPAPDHPPQDTPGRKGSLRETGAPTKTEVLCSVYSQTMRCLQMLCHCLRPARMSANTCYWAIMIDMFWLLLFFAALLNKASWVITHGCDFNVIVSRGVPRRKTPKERWAF